MVTGIRAPGRVADGIRHFLRQWRSVSVVAVWIASERVARGGDLDGMLASSDVARTVILAWKSNVMGMVFEVRYRLPNSDPFRATMGGVP